MTRRQARRPSTPPRPPVARGDEPDPAKDRALNVATAIVLSVLGLIVLAFLMIPVTWALVHGYRWAIG